jgi:predicted PurR-regulated permease PerM
MTALLPDPVVRPQGGSPDPVRTLDTLATAIVILITVGVLYFAREILVPIAIAILLSFVLSPPVKLLRTIGLPKPLSVAAVVLLAFAIAVGLGFELTKQIGDLAADAPRYQATVTRKVGTAQEFIANNPLLSKINSIAADLTRTPLEANKPKPAEPGQKAAPKDAPRAEAPKPVPVQVVSPPPGVLAILQTVGAAAASPLATAAFVALFIIFILMQREDLRNRFIRLVGFGDINRTTLAMNEAARRLSRYFLAQVLLNTGFGIVAAGLLALIGVPSAILWGIVAIFMRFIPYLGSIGAAFFPVAMAAAASPGWSMALEAALAIVVLEIVTGQAVEPLVYGRHTGVSPIAVVVSATFWTWLWGPVGLVLATPLTVCLVVMGRHVERFAFFDVILGDEPPLTAAQTFYQRMLVGDPSEIVDHAEGFLQANSLLDYCDTVAMKALLMAQTDVRRGVLEESRQTRIRDAMRDLVDDLADLDRTAIKAVAPPDAPALTGPAGEQPVKTEAVEPEEAPAIAEPWMRDGAVVCVAGRTPLDEAAAHLLSDLLGQHGIGARVEPAEKLVANELAHLAAGGPQLILLSFLDADLSVAQARFAVRRLRRHAPNVPLAAAFWMPEADESRTAGLCAEVRCDTCVSSLPQALALCLERAAATPAAEAPTPKGLHIAEPSAA